MNSEEIDRVLNEYGSENSEIKLVNMLKERLVERMESFSTDDSDANEHRLNMLIRELEEDLDRIENEKLGDWDPERK